MNCLKHIQVSEWPCQNLDMYLTGICGNEYSLSSFSELKLCHNNSIKTQKEGPNILTLHTKLVET